MRQVTREIELLARLVSFPSMTDGPNLDLVDWVQAYLADAGFEVARIPSACGAKAGLLARFGTGAGGVLLSGHSDVVPVSGQKWKTDPFTLVEDGDRLVGRGSTDMKGFLACVLALAGRVKAFPPKHPLMVVLSWDEEIGCRGISEMIDHVLPVLGRPDVVIVGEPTEMRLCIGHKGKASYRATCRGDPGHSAMAPLFTNALHLGADLIQALRRVQDRIVASGSREEGYQIPYATLHAGWMSGGLALNMVPEEAVLEFEIRHLFSETADAILAEVMDGLPAGIEISQVNAYPDLNSDPTHPAISALAEHLDDPTPIKVSYGTEAGYFAGLGLPTVVCGPGNMADGHQPNESIDRNELARCSAFLEALLSEASG